MILSINYSFSSVSSVSSSVSVVVSLSSALSVQYSTAFLKVNSSLNFLIISRFELHDSFLCVLRNEEVVFCTCTYHRLAPRAPKVFGLDLIVPEGNHTCWYTQNSTYRVSTGKLGSPHSPGLHRFLFLWQEYTQPGGFSTRTKRSTPPCCM